MRSPLQQTRVLCISRDPQLLQTRQKVFETRYHAVSIGSVDEMRSIAAEEGFDILILCHSLASEEFDSAVRYARDRWPGIKTIELTVGETNRGEAADRSVRGLDGPRVLLRTMEHLQVA